MDDDDAQYEAAKANAMWRTLHAALLMFGLGGLLIAWRFVSPEDWPGPNAWVAPALAGALLAGGGYALVLALRTFRRAPS